MIQIRSTYQFYVTCERAKMVAKKLIRKKPKEFTIKDNIIVGDELKFWETRCIAQIVWESLSAASDFICQINADTREETTFAEIKDRSARCAIWLRKQGISKNDIIAISTPNQNDDIVPYLATFFVGAIVNPWYHELTEVNVRRFMRTYQPKLMFAYEGSIDQLARIAAAEGIACRFVVFDRHPKYPSLRRLLAEQSAEEVASFEYTVPPDPRRQCAMIMFSSGTTGTPKGTMLSYDAVANCSNYFDVEGSKRWLWYSSLSWITGAYLALMSIHRRATRIIHREFETEGTSRVIETYKVNWTLWSPSMLIQNSKANVFDRYDFSSLETLIVGGSKLSRTIMEETQRALPHCFVGNCYGMTELGGLCVQQRQHDRKRMVAAGYVVAGAKLKVIDRESGRALGPNKQGEICIHKRTVLLGYYNNPEATAETLDEEGWVHTGDLGYYDEDGEVMVTDRIKQLIITENFHVSPSEIEDILLKHPGVKDCAVVPVPHEIDIERPFAFVVKVPGAEVTEEELKELPTSWNEFYRLSGGVAFINDLVYTATGKKSLQLLKEKAKEYVARG